MRPITVLIVDEHTEVRELLARRLDSHPHFRVIGCTGDPVLASDMANFWEPDVILLDPKRLKGSAGGTEAYKRIAGASPGSHIVIFTSYFHPAEEEPCRGATRIPKSIGFNRLLWQLRRLARSEQEAVTK